MSGIPDTSIPDPGELSRLFSQATGEPETLDDRDRTLLCVWEKRVRAEVQERTTHPSGEPHRWHLPDERQSLTHGFEIPISEGGTFKGFVTMGLYPSGQLGEIFLTVSKEGAFASGIMDAMAKCLSIALQHGVPLQIFTSKFKHTNFEPAGMVQGAPPELRGFASSILDYLAKYLDLRFPAGSLDLPKPVDGRPSSPIR